MRNHLLHMNGKGRIVAIEAGTPSEVYGALQTTFEKEAGSGGKFDFSDFITLYDEQKIGSIYYDEELSGPGGMSFRLWAMPGTKKAEIAAAKRQLYRDRDVTRMQVFAVNQLI